MSKPKIKMEYPFEIGMLPENDGGGYLITFPDLPGCMSDGKTVELAIKNGQDAVWCWLEVAKERGQDIPKPGASHSGQYVQRLPKSLHARLAALARAEGTSMNQLALTFIAEGVALNSVATEGSGWYKPLNLILKKPIGKKTTRIIEEVARSSVTSKRGGRGKSVKVRVGKRTTKKTVKRKSAG